MYRRLQVWCRDKLVGHFAVEQSEGMQKIVLANRTWFSDPEAATSTYQLKEFSLAQRHVTMADSLMFGGSAAQKTFLEIHKIPDYAEVFDWPETWEKRFLWAILDISPEDYEEFIFDNDSFEPE
jgi:hypothetical protein